MLAVHVELERRPFTGPDKGSRGNGVLETFNSIRAAQAAKRHCAIIKA